MLLERADGLRARVRAAATGWAINEKGLVVDVAGLAIGTHDFAARAGSASTGRGQLAATVDEVVHQLARD